MTGPTRTFDPFSNSGAAHAADLKAISADVGQQPLTATAAMTTESALGATAAAVNPTAAASINPAAPKTAGIQPRHTSIFEIGGEPFGDGPVTAAPSARLGRVARPGKGGSLSSATSPVGLRPLGSIMGSSGNLFDSAYSGQPPVAAHRLSRFGSALGEPGVLPATARGGDNEPIGMQSTTVDMSNGLLDTIKSQQASPNSVQPGINDFFVKSLPVSRRNSREFQNLWQELDGFSINDSSAHRIPFDGHSIAARNSSSAFRNNAAGAGMLGTSPKLPQGLLDEDLLSGQPKQPSSMLNGSSSVGGIHRAPGSGLLHMGSSSEFAHNPTSFSAYAQEAQPQMPRQPLVTADAVPADASQNPQLYDSGRAASLVRNSSTPVLNTSQYQTVQTTEDSVGHLRTVPSVSGLADASGLLYSHQYPVYAAPVGDALYDAAGGRLPQNANYPYGPNGPMMGGASRAPPFASGGTPGSGSGSATPVVNGYGMQGPPFASASAANIYGMGQVSLQQHSHYAPSHIHVHTQPQGQLGGQGGNSKHPNQRHSAQQPASLAVSAPPQQQQPKQQQQKQQQAAQSSSHHNQKHNHAKSHRKADPDANRFINAQLEDLKGSIFEVCKDQYGCRFLQKKLEEGQEKHVTLIFKEALPHFSTLMTDPFGNYLCQKLLEHCSESQRTQIVVGVAPDLVNVSLNMHGTRAVQKLIELLSSQKQIDAIIEALSDRVVTLIRDLNGNHVIQKCLSRFTSENNQFIYNSVAASCIDVATHRHGCCVFQRCIDHASNAQKSQLVEVIIVQALSLVQDPFGNYVVQYVLDLGVRDYSDPLILKFVDHICGLSVQKFSSNVMEKCIRLASPHTRKLLVAPLMQREKLEMLMRDSYGNYVVQTALDFADQHQRVEIIEAILPLLPLIRNTPYGKRIYSKLQRDGFISAVPSAAGSRHASPTLGPTHGAHSSTSISAMSLYPHGQNSGMPPPAANAAAAGAALSRGVSPAANGSKPPISQPRPFAQCQANSAFQQQQQQQQQHAGGMYYYNMVPVDASGQPQAHNAVPLMASVHPNSMPSMNGGHYDQAGVASVPSVSAPSSAAAGSSRTSISSPTHQNSR
ncbi:hypothetical protein LPJ78_000936 [Coemansia sp. RSA 989]|nr:hypothetical protein LPJ79_000856 [Coemansia sp. RSA 1821]KAJ1867526.1 hypothetical protein LPJ78_000936 [Coemansia sp. RSA 989]KAJ2673535.1 hypothetical protein IWW42_002258 [Coemansia sp. RSA 1085]